MRINSVSIKRRLILLFILSFFLFQGLTFLDIGQYAASQSDEDSPIYFVKGDVLKGFKFDKFNGETVTLGGGAYDNKIKFESEGLFSYSPDDIEIVYSHTQGNTTIIYYKLPVTMNLNIITNIRLDDAVAKMKKDSETVEVVEYQHHDWLGNEIVADAWKAHRTFHFWDFGNVRAFHSSNNLFEGDLEMTFQIDDSPLPESIKDEEGNSMSKEFDYIGVSSATVLSSQFGLLSDADPHLVQVVSGTPEEESETEDDISDPTSFGDVHADFYINSNAKLTKIETESHDTGLNIPSRGSSLNPTQMDGSPIFDNTMESEKSQKDARITLNIGSMSPMLKVYKCAMEYTHTKLKVKDVVLGSPIVDWWMKDLSTGLKPVAYQIINRYASIKLQIVLNIYTGYGVKIMNSPDFENIELEEPQEHYDNVTWLISDEGFSGAEGNEGTSLLGQFLDQVKGALENALDFLGFGDFGGFVDIVVLIGVIFVILIGICIFYKVGKGFFRRHRVKNSNKDDNNGEIFLK